MTGEMGASSDRNLEKASSKTFNKSPLPRRWSAASLQIRTLSELCCGE